MTDQRARALIARYDLVDVTRCGEGWREMQRDDQYGDWVSYEDHMAALADERRRALEEAANLYESIKPSCDHEPGCGAGAMGAVLQFRDLIRAKAHAGQEG